MAPEPLRTPALRLLSAMLCLVALASPAHALRFMAYNILNYPGTTGATRDPSYPALPLPSPAPRPPPPPPWGRGGGAGEEGISCPPARAVFPGGAGGGGEGGARMPR